MFASAGVKRSQERSGGVFAERRAAGAEAVEPAVAAEPTARPLASLLVGEGER